MRRARRHLLYATGVAIILLTPRVTGVPPRVPIPSAGLAAVLAESTGLPPLQVVQLPLGRFVAPIELADADEVDLATRLERAWSALPPAGTTLIEGSEVPDLLLELPNAPAQGMEVLGGQDWGLGFGVQVIEDAYRRDWSVGVRLRLDF